MAAKLTPRELRICQLLAEGSNNQEIANQLGITVVNVRTRCYKVCIKTGMSDRLELALWYIRNRDLYESDGKPGKLTIFWSDLRETLRRWASFLRNLRRYYS